MEPGKLIQKGSLDQGCRWVEGRHSEGSTRWPGIQKQTVKGKEVGWIYPGGWGMEPHRGLAKRSGRGKGGKGPSLR